MAVSILHRATGTGMATLGALVFIWWLAAAASGPDAYATFYNYVVAANEGDSGAFAVNVLMKLVGVGLTWAFFQHLFSGLRHFVLDIGAGYDLKVNKTVAILTMAGALLVTLAIWGTIFAKMGAH